MHSESLRQSREKYRNLLNGSSLSACKAWHVPFRLNFRPAAAPAAFYQALVSELKEELMRLVGSTKKTQKIDNAPGMEVGGNAAWLIPTGGGVLENRAKSSDVVGLYPSRVHPPPTLSGPTFYATRPVGLAPVGFAVVAGRLGHPPAAQAARGGGGGRG